MQKFKDVLYITVTTIILTSSFLWAYINLGYIQIKQFLACVVFFLSFQIAPLELVQCNSSWLTL